MSAIVLVPGAWLGGWAWQQVESDLTERGHDVRPITLAGVGGRADEAGPNTDLEQHVVRSSPSSKERIFTTSSSSGTATAAWSYPRPPAGSPTGSPEWCT